MIIRIATKNDEKQLREYISHYNKKQIINNRVDCYTSHNRTIIALENNEIIGTLQWHIKENPNSGVAEFEEVYVDKDKRGKNIGSELVIFAIKDIKQFFESMNIKPRKIFLFVSKVNIPARKLYEKFNFKYIAELNDVFKDNLIETFYCFSFD
jgi:ribosomal protein S18 acetylase RimI-like enzyme